VLLIEQEKVIGNTGKKRLRFFSRDKTLIFLYRRLVGTQFPPWTEGTDVWGVQHMMHPDLKEPVFAEWYGSEKLLAAVEQLLHTKHEDLQLGKLCLFHLFNK
jgi:hypothetical protein